MNRKIFYKKNKKIGKIFTIKSKFLAKLEKGKVRQNGAEITKRFCLKGDNFPRFLISERDQDECIFEWLLSYYVPVVFESA